MGVYSQEAASCLYGKEVKLRLSWLDYIWRSSEKSKDSFCFIFTSNQIINYGLYFPFCF